MMLEETHKGKQPKPKPTKFVIISRLPRKLSRTAYMIISKLKLCNVMEEETSVENIIELKDRMRLFKEGIIPEDISEIRQ